MVVSIVEDIRGQEEELLLQVQ